ncbi:hypothetical protein [Desulfovirgula thermocuniculi]|uniref:hypothetical protein n=1 Tax=Desulfovirgula thermocuniculi TaxID=348842 RepID=UPI0003F743FE|nr:hypothetical protein [Desulfovirgula thermocuniculi]
MGKGDFARALDAILGLVVALSVALAVAAAAGNAMVQGDTLWHVKAGEWILDNRAVPRADPFSWTAPGAPWHAHEWLWEVLAALLWRAAGPWGVWSLVALGALLAAGCSYGLALRRSGSPAWAAACTSLAAGALAPFLSARPHTLALGLFALWVLVLDAARGRPRFAALAAPLGALWANAHASAPAGALAGAAFLAADALAGRRPAPAQATALLIFAASVNLNPWGPEVWAFAVAVSSRPELVNLISEWQSPNFHSPFLWPCLALVGALCLLWGRSDRALRLLAAGAFAAGLLSLRHLPYFLLLWPAAAAPALAARFGGPGRKTFVAGSCVAAAAALAVALAALPPNWLEKPQEGEPFPVAAVRFMKERGLTEGVFNHYTWGGYLVWEGVRPFIDGRADMYLLSGSGVLEDYDAAAGILRRPDPDGVFERRGVRVVLVPAKSWLALYLSRHPDWEEAYRDETAAVFARRPRVSPPGGSS